MNFSASIFNLHAFNFPQYLSAFFLTIVLVLLMMPFAQRLGLVDMPNQRKLHGRSTPLVGGIAMMVAIIVVTMQFQILDSEMVHLLLAIAIVGITGVMDDRLDISPRLKFISQILAALVVIMLCDQKVTSLGNLFGFGVVLLPSPLAELMTVVCIVGVINAINMADGLDGLAAGIAIVSCLAFAYVALAVGNYMMLNLIIVTMAAVLAFLLFNIGPPLRQHALVFMGDAGSMLLGLLVTVFAIHVTSDSAPGVVPPMIAVWIIGLPLMDMASVMLRRYRRKLKLTVASNLHLHHMLVKAGYSRHFAAMVKVLLTWLMAAVGVVAWHYQVPEYVMFYSFLLLMALYHRRMCKQDDGIVAAA